MCACTFATLPPAVTHSTTPIDWNTDVVTFFDVQDVFGGGGKKTMRFKPAMEQRGG